MIVVVSFWCYHCCWFLLVSFSVSFRCAPTSTFSNFPSRLPCFCSIAKRGATRRVVVSLGVCITCFCHCLISTQTFQRVLTASVDSCAEMKEYMPFQWCNQLWQSLEFKVPGSEAWSMSFPVKTLLRCPHSPGVQSHAPASARTLKIPNTDSHTIVWTHENCTAHILWSEWVATTQLFLRLLLKLV